MFMGFRLISRLSVFVAMAALACAGLQAQNTLHRGRKYKAPPPVSRVDVTILRGDDGSPIENASVIFQLVDDKGNMELKTDQDGKTFIDVLPTGSKFILQVIAKGYQTFGKSYDLDKKELAIEVKMNRPGKQYSIYDKHTQAARTGGTSVIESGKPADGSASSKTADQDKQSTESAQDSPQKPETSQPQPQ
jgi:hypothetical protein